MDHEAIRGKLSALYDREFTAADRREVELHLASCSECRRLSRQWERIAQALFRIPEGRPTEAFVHRLMNRIEAVEQPRRATSRTVGIRWLAPALGLASLLLLALGSMQHPVSLETLLLADARESAPIQFALASEPPTTDEVFGYLMEGHP